MASEREPSININLGNTNFEMTPHNSSLFTFLGRAALYNHIFLVRDDLPPLPEGQLNGTYLFEGLLRNKNIYSRLEQMMTEKQYPMHLNALEAPECDVDAYIRTASNMIGDTVPEGWE